MLPGRSAQVFPKQAGKTFVGEKLLSSIILLNFSGISEAFYSRFPYNLGAEPKFASLVL